MAKKETLEHPFDDHALTLREISKDYQVQCNLCSEHFHGPTYCCEDCLFFLHRACALIELPTQLHNHPAHPQHHTLNLVHEERRYRCTDCECSLAAATAVATRLPVDDIEEELDSIIQHCLHGEHPLSSFRVQTALEDECKLCREKINAGRVYGCRACLFLMHEECACFTIAPEIQHPLHPQHPLNLCHLDYEEEIGCKVCGYTLTSEHDAYRCTNEGCNFSLDLRCALTMLARNITKKAHGEYSSSYSMIHHYSHQHQMTAFHVNESFKSDIWCELCRFNISGSEVLACGDCNFFLHKSCAKELPKEIQHFLHPQHPLVLRTEAPQYEGRRLLIQCNSCRECRSFMAFSCEGCDFNLDPACALHTLSAVKEEVLDYNPHPAHDHPLMLAFWKLEDMSIRKPTCIACNQCIDGVEYHCFTCHDFWLHKSCADQLPLELEHTLHPQHPLVLSKPLTSYFICNVCHDENEICFFRDQENLESLAYYCAKCEFYVDTRCALPNRTLKHPLHEHRLAYCKENTTKQFLCICCSKRCGYDFYCCLSCNFSLHCDCLFLPPIIHHKCHPWHPLRLCDKFVDGNPDDLYCDYCETIRHPDHGVYRCEEKCSFAAHIECMTSDRNVSLQATEMVTIGNDRCNQLNIEIAGLKVKIEIILRNLEAKNGNLKKLVKLLDEIERVSKEQGRLIGVPENPQLFPTVSSEVTVAKGLIKHPFHEHALNLRLLSEKCQLECSLCSLYFNGSAYCCEGCGYFLHRTCALEEPPSQIQHPSHPQHPLTLSDGLHHKYSCNDCQYSLNVLTALATLSPLGFDEKEVNEDDDEEWEIIQHCDYCKHPLTSFHVEMQLLDECKVCHQYISGQFYGCTACLLLLHASCARPPRVLHHPFKSLLTLSRSCSNGEHCGFCGDYLETEFVYTSNHEDGDHPFLLHVGCALSTSFPRGHRSTYSSSDYKKHSSHPCPLVLFHVEEKKTGRLVKCEFCELKISGEARGCPDCRFFLHESCMDKFPDVVHHFLHPNHPNLILKHKEPSASQTKEYGCHCTICLRKATPKSRITYQCDSCEFHLHPNCALKTLAAVQEGVAPSIHHFWHDHPLFLHFFKGNRSVGWCTTCGEIIIGLAYCCITCENISFHKSCAELPRELEHSFHPQHQLVLVSEASGGYCRACYKKSTCAAYYCPECEFYLDLQCACLNLAVKHPRHEHKLAYFEESTNSYSLCGACGRSCKRDLYLCVPCDFSIHHDCLPLPAVVEMKCPQKHQLFLRDRFVNGDPNCQYCDHCEELRNPDHGAYVCEECPHTVHIDCAIPRDKVEIEANETELEAEGTENEPEEIEASQMLVPSRGNSEAALLKGRIDVLKRNMEAETGNLEASMKHLEELETERETECK